MVISFLSSHDSSNKIIINFTIFLEVYGSSINLNNKYFNSICGIDYSFMWEVSKSLVILFIF